MADAFYEVDEQLRSARLQTLFRRSAPYLAGLIVLVLVAAVSVWAWRNHETALEGSNSMAYAKAMEALGRGDTASADAGFAGLAKDGAPAYKALALMQQAGLKVKAADPAGAAGLFDQAAVAARDPVTADAARLKAAFVLMDTAPYDQVRARLLPLAGAKRPFHLLAREALATEELAHGRAAEAKGDFQVLALSPDVSDTTRARANAALSMIGSGAAANIAAIAWAAVPLKAAPPPPAQGQLTPEQAAALARAQAQAQAQGQGQAQPQGAAQAPAGASQ